MASPTDVLRIAASLIGTAEQPKGSNNVPGITDWYGIKGPWCAMFVSKCFADAGMPAVRFAYCPDGVSRFKSGQLGTWHDGMNGALPGDVVFFKLGTAAGISDHVGIVEAASGGTMTTIEGNTSDQVMRHNRRSQVLGYGRPKFDGAPSGVGFHTIGEVADNLVPDNLNPLDQLASMLAPTGAFFGLVTESGFWLRVGGVVVGLAAIVGGLLILKRDTAVSIGKAAAALHPAGKVAKVAAVAEAAG